MENALDELKYRVNLAIYYVLAGCNGAAAVVVRFAKRLRAPPPSADGAGDGAPGSEGQQQQPAEPELKVDIVRSIRRSLGVPCAPKPPP